VGVGSKETFEKVNRALEVSRIYPAIDREFLFTEAPQAFARLNDGPFGKIVVRIDEE
jgi:NADPH:quinone reductase-like Zn-dependent oxidoreductase